MKKNMGKIILAGLAVLCLLGIIRQEWIEKESNRQELTAQEDKSVKQNDRTYKIVKKTENDTDEEVYANYNISKEYYPNYNAGGLQTYTITKMYEEQTAFVAGIRRNQLCTYIYENGGGCIEIQMTEEQRQAWLTQIDKNIDEVLNRENELIKMELSEDDSELTIQISGAASAADVLSDLKVVVSNGELRQIFNGKTDWSMRIKAVNMKNGHTLTDIYAQEEDFELTPEMWKKSEE